MAVEVETDTSGSDRAWRRGNGRTYRARHTVLILSLTQVFSLKMAENPIARGAILRDARDRCAEDYPPNGQGSTITASRMGICYRLELVEGKNLARPGATDGTCLCRSRLE